MRRAGFPICFLTALGLWSLYERRFLLVDDAYIAFRYAANFASGRGLVWNAGEHVEGYTNLLWVLLLSIPARLGVDLTWPAVCTSFAFAAGTIALTSRLVLAASSSPWTGVLCGLLLATNASFVNAATSGMETTLFGFLVLLGVHWLVLGREQRKFRLFAAISFALAYLTRPEGILVAAVAIAVEMATASGSPAQRARSLAPVAGIVAIVAALHVAVRLAYYGYAFPNTFYAKVIFGVETLRRGVAHVAGFLLAGGFVALPGVAELRRDNPTRPLLLHGYALFFAYLGYLLVIGGDHPHWYRFYVPLLPLTFLGTAEWVERLSRRTVPATALVVSSGALSFSFGERREVIGRLSERDAAVLLRTTDFFRHEVPQNGFVAAATVGHLGYYAPGLHVLDMWGLNDAHIAHRDVAPSTKFGHDKYDLQYVAQMKPDYVYELLPIPPPALPGYDLCWPSRNFPVAVYRRNFALGAEEVGLGVSPLEKRSLAAPPACKPP